MKIPPRKKERKVAGRNLKKAYKTVAKGKKQVSKATAKASVQTGKAKTKSRIKATHGTAKVQSGKAAIANRGRTKAKKRAGNTPNINYGAPGQKKYLTLKGKQTDKA